MIEITRTNAAASVLLFLLLLPTAAAAQLSPGELHESHKQLEGIENCTRCHEVGRKLSPARCLACHRILAGRIEAGEGLHAGDEFEKCGSCHVDHQGREYDLVWWKDGIDRFDHRKTGYPLEGGHLRPACRECHRPDHIRNRGRLTATGKKLDRTWLGLEKECTTCHRDVHEGELPGGCLSCHKMEKWRPASLFDHHRARFVLTGKHTGVDCAKCHGKKRIGAQEPSGGEGVTVHFRGIPFAWCGECHADPHEGRLGPSCERCHDTNSWRDAGGKGFDHTKTAFPLLGAHATVPCGGCHRNGASHRVSKFGKCDDCHADVHGDSFAGRGDEEKCASCHTVERFSPSTFTVARHDETVFPLEGAHRAAPCDLCHRKETTGAATAILLFPRERPECDGCHDDPHGNAGKEEGNRCAACHTTTGWADVGFDHDTTRFPLAGAHRRLACAKCHSAPGGEPAGHLRFSKMAARPVCGDCHDDRHRGQFAGVQEGDGISNASPRCDRCHTAANWIGSRFDHDTMASFRLTGAHQHISCPSCHPTVEDDIGRYTIYRPLKKECRWRHRSGAAEKLSGMEGKSR